MRLFAAAALACVALTACGGESGPPRVEAQEVWVRLPAVPGQPGAAYFTLEASRGPVTLEGLESPKAQRIELHETREENGVSRMQQVVSVPFPASGTVEFKPGGRHAMLIGLESGLQPGGTIPLAFRFRGADPVTVEAELRGPSGEPAHDSH